MNKPTLSTEDYLTQRLQEIQLEMNELATEALFFRRRVQADIMRERGPNAADVWKKVLAELDQFKRANILRPRIER